jgi:hypothetical protein
MTLDHTSGTSPRTRIETMTNQAIPVMELFNYRYLSPLSLSLVLCLIKPIAPVCSLKMAEDALSTYFASYFFSLAFIVLYLVDRGKWMNLA